MTDQPTTPAVQQRETFTFAATGDSILTRPILPYEGTAPRFDRMLDRIRGVDAAFTNLEVLVHDYESPPGATSGGTYMRAPPSVLDELSGMGFSLFSAATNHTFDFGPGGVRRTLDAVRERNLAVAGLGTSLFEARSPTYLETPAGRVALVSVCTSITAGSEAGEQSAGFPGRPGLSPLHVEQVYRVREDRIDDLRAVSEAAGIEAVKQSWLDRGLYYGRDWTNERYFHLGDLKFEPVDDEADEGVAHVVDEADLAALRKWLGEADAQADYVVCSIHTHQGAGGRQTTLETPDFLVDVAHDCVDAGADVVVGHGPHVLRGVELYDDAPIFYSLGNYIVQNETVERLPLESTNRYGLGPDATVADVFEARLFDDEGAPKGDLANVDFWETVVPVCEFGPDGVEVTLYPVSLQRTCPRPQRGIPVLAEGTEAERILDTVASLSEPFGTTLEREGDAAVVRAEHYAAADSGGSG